MTLEYTMYAVDPVRATGLGGFGVLPDAIVSVLTFYLDTRSICRLACCSKLWRVFAYESPLWMDQALRGHAGPVSYKANWRQTALSLIYRAAQRALEVHEAALDIQRPKAAATYSTMTDPKHASETLLAAHDQAPSQRTASIQKLHQMVQHLAVAVAAAVQPVPSVAGFTSDFLYRRWYRSNMSLVTFFPPVDQVPRVQHSNLSPGEFVRCYDMPAQPVILTGFMDAEWPAGWQDHWLLDNLTATYGEAELHASRPSGGKTSVRFSDYVGYMLRQTDEDPLYIFDEGFGETVPAMLEWYKSPSVVNQDFNELLEPSSRPPYRWLVLGPARAGASWHVDPALTSAWNALTSGLKRWALYPPHVKPPGLVQLQQLSAYAAAAVTGSAAGSSSSSVGSSSCSSSWCTVSDTADDVSECGSTSSSSSSSSGSWSSSSSGGGDDESDSSPGGGLTSLQWYLEVYPYLPPHMRPYEFVQHPGEIVFIPGGWWHCVLNLEPSVAITQNFVSQANLERVVAQSAVGSRAYHEDPLRFYELQRRPWVAAWEEHQRQQWQQQQQQHMAEQQQHHHHHQQQQHCVLKQQQQQQQQEEVCSANHVCLNPVVGNTVPGEVGVTSTTAAAAAPAAATGIGGTPHLSAAAATATAAVSSSQPGLQPLPIRVKVRASPFLCCSSSSSRDESSTITHASSSMDGSGHDQVAASILAADIYCHGSTLPTAAAAAAADLECEDHPWSGLLTAVAGGRGYLGSRLVGPLMKRIWEQQEQQGGGSHQQQQQQQRKRGFLQRQQQQQQQGSSLQQRLAEIANEWLAQREWQQLLGCICEVHGVCSTCELDHELAFPEGGADSLAFTIKDVVVKFLVGQQELPGELAAAVEARTLLQLQQQQHMAPCGKMTTTSRQEDGNTTVTKSSALLNKHNGNKSPYLSCPRLIGHGTVHVSDAITEPTQSPAAAAAATATTDAQRSSSSSSSHSWRIPYLVVSRVQGQGTASALKPQLHDKQKQHLAWSCGQLLAAVHRLPGHCTYYSSSSSSGGGDSSSSAEACGSSSSSGRGGNIAQQLLQGSFWRDRSGNIWSSELGFLDAEQQQQQQQQQQKLAGEAALCEVEGSAAETAVRQLSALQLQQQQQQQQKLAGEPALCEVEGSAAETAVRQLSALQLQQQQEEEKEKEESEACACSAAAAAAGLWQPFIQFLQQRRSEVLQQLAEERSWLADLGVVASEVYAQFPQAADTLAAAQQQQQQQGSSSSKRTCRVAGSSSSMDASADCTADSSSTYDASCCSTNCTAAGIVRGIGSTAAAVFPFIGVGDHCLPAWLVQQLPDYISQDMGVLVGVPTAAAAAAAAAKAGMAQSGAGMNGGDTAAAATSVVAVRAATAAGDAGVVDGISSSNSGNGIVKKQPCLLHGDLMAGNILLQLPEAQLALKGLQQQQQGEFQQQQQQQPQCSSCPVDSLELGLRSVSFIDFADGGMGDPLYDFVAVFVSVLDCDMKLLQVALESYCSSLDVAAVWPARSASVAGAAGTTTVAAPSPAVVDLARYYSTTSCNRTNVKQQSAAAGNAAYVPTASKQIEGGAEVAHARESTVSKAFMCYMLLHEEGVLGQLFEEHPQLRCAGSLQEMQQQLFGWMDVWWAKQVLGA